MCSILGIISKEKINKDLLKKSSALLKLTTERGPDDSGSVVVNKQVYLGNNRLSIIDKSLKGHMPMKSLRGDYWITYNGEIYNYTSLKNQLTDKGFKFKSESDTEVVLNAYICWGDKFVEKLNGIFAFLIFDKKLNKIITARDRFGAKPLYYSKINNSIIFSSDFDLVKNLVYPENKNLDHSALTSYMLCRFVPGDKTILKNIFKLQPAQIKIWNLKNLSSKSRKFWQPEFKPQKFSQKEFNKKLDDAIKYIKTADLNPSVLLSGGLDSAAIAAILKRQGNKNIKTFTCSFTNPDIEKKTNRSSYYITTPNIDESSYAKLVADSLEFKNKAFFIDYDINIDTFLKMQKILGEPIASTNALGNYLFAIKLNGRTKLGITGTGSDELLGGYKDLYFKNKIKTLKTIDDPKIFLNAFANFDSNKQYPLDYLKNDLIDDDYILDFTTKAMDSFPKNNHKNELLNQLTFFEMAFALPGWELDQADRLFMSQSIELRPGLLENNFVDYCLTIPSEEKLNKKPLKKAVKNILPRSIYNRPKYPGLGTPKDVYNKQWFKIATEELFNNTADIFDKKNIALLAKQPYEKWNFDIIYRLIYLQLWLKDVI